MGSQLRFAFGVHNHQPVGNFAEIIARAHERAYAPFLDTVSRYAGVKFSLHISGSLLEWMEREAAATVELIRELVAQGQCEIWAGTYYESLAPVAPEHDVTASIRAYAKKLGDVFETEARGIWLAERVYEPHLPRLLSETGMEYTVLDDWHFKVAGIREEELNRPWLTEHQGATMTVCPISQRLRYMVPFEPVEAVLESLREVYEAGGRLICLADDGEKFGEWPGTFERCYPGGWLAEFFAALGSQSDWLRATTLGEALGEVPAAGPVYFPATSYYEMTRWALPAERQRRLDSLGPDFGPDGPNGDLVTGAAFKSFFQKYPEVNYWHKRVQKVSQRLEEASGSLNGAGEEIRRHIWRAEANDAYWHGVFGGLYLPHLRRGVREELVRAERKLDAALGSTGEGDISDFDADGGAEITIKNDNLVVVLKPAEGLVGAEFTRRSPASVLTDVPPRREELYHGELDPETDERIDNVKTIHGARTSKEPGLARFLVYDRRPKRLFLERVFDGASEVVGYAKEETREFVGFRWGLPERTPQGWGIEGTLRADGYGDINVRKEVNLTDRGVTAACSIRPDLRETLLFGLEITLSITSEFPEYSFVNIGERYHCQDIFAASVGERVEVVDRLADWRLLVKAEPGCTLWHAPLHTINSSECGFEKVYQGSSFYFWVELSRGSAGTEFRLALSLD